MHAVVVYESAFGNATRIAEAIADGLSSAVRVELFDAGSAPAHLGEHVKLLVVGGPTQAHGLSRRATRNAAVDYGAKPTAASGPGVREWLAALPARPGLAAAAFDTRMRRSRWLTGSAARTMAKRLDQHRLRLVTPPESFYVRGVSGPLADGELDRARSWGRMLARLIEQPAQHP